jgi:hypothetical protein
MASKWKVKTLNLYPIYRMENVEKEIEKAVNELLATIDSEEVVIKVDASIVLIFYKEA